MPVRVAIVDDSLIVREGLGRLLALEPDIELVASCPDSDALVRSLDAGAPDVVLTDIRMPPTHADEGIRLAASLRETHPDIGVVVLSEYAEPEYALALLESGSDGRAYLLKERVRDRGQLVSAIGAVARGESMIDPGVVEVLVTAQARGEHSALAELTGREREVLAEIAQGASNAAIAESLVLSKRAVEKHINSIFMKLGLGDAHAISKRVKATLLFLAEHDRRGDAPGAGSGS